MARSIDQLPGDLQRKVSSMDRVIKARRRDVALAAARKAADEQRAAMRQDSGGDLQLSGVGRRRGRAGNARLNAVVTVYGQAVRVNARGPLPLIDRDTPGHVIRSAYIKGAYRSSRSRKTGRTSALAGPAAPGQFRGDNRAVLNIPGIGFRRSARHSGTRGKATWSRGQNKGLAAAAVTVGVEMDRALTEGFREG